MKKLIIYVLLLACGKTFAQDTKVTITGGAIGGGSGNNIYNIDSSLSSDRTVDLNGKVLSFKEGGINQVEIDPVQFKTTISSDDGSSDARLILHGNSVSPVVTFDLIADGDVETVRIKGDATANTIDYTAATQTITAPTLFHITPDGVNDLLKVNPITFSSMIQGYDGTAESQIETSADLVGNAVFISLISNDGGANTAAITLDGQASTIKLTGIASGLSTDSVLTRDASTGIVNMRDVTKLVTLQNAYDQFLATWDFASPAINGHNQPLEFDSLGDFFVRAYNGPGTTVSYINMDGSTGSFANQGLNGNSGISVGDTVTSLNSNNNGNDIGTHFVVTPHYLKVYQGNVGNTDDSIVRFIMHIDSTSTVDYNSIVYFNANHDMLRGHMPSMLLGSASLNFGSTAAGTSTDLTITVTGAVSGDVVAVGVPNGSTVANGVFSCWVSAADTVTVRFTNTNLVTALDPSSGTFKVKVIKD